MSFHARSVRTFLDTDLSHIEVAGEQQPRSWFSELSELFTCCNQDRSDMIRMMSASSRPGRDLDLATPRISKNNFGTTPPMNPSLSGINLSAGSNIGALATGTPRILLRPSPLSDETGPGEEGFTLVPNGRPFGSRGRTSSLSADVQGTAFVHSPREGSSLPARRPDTATVEQEEVDAGWFNEADAGWRMYNNATVAHQADLLKDIVDRETQIRRLREELDQQKAKLECPAEHTEGSGLLVRLVT